ncbi:MAG: Uncharacterized protein CEO12_323 [Parcubacteria group bacterium Gr01-1014_46]|nr:MAG: Uncharacterized protein CEO12_323 [Parcubacteria group bacterium Gr01-1014_46]
MENTELDKAKSDLNSQKNPEFNVFFDADSDFVFICKKTEKLASAVYLITNLFSDNEPMKWTLRKKVSELLSFVTTYKDIRQSELPNFVHTSKTKVSEILSLLEVSLFAGLVSQMNFSILGQEFTNLIELLKNNNQKSDFSNNLIPKTFFEANRPSFALSPVSVSANIKDNFGIKDDTAFKSNNRQNIILGLLKKKKDLTIKDIAVIIKDVSEKTIQRELISLISAGVINKTGERRWSRYSLKVS